MIRIKMMPIIIEKTSMIVIITIASTMTSITILANFSSIIIVISILTTAMTPTKNTTYTATIWAY
jgi:hypothetical protein